MKRHQCLAVGATLTMMMAFVTTTALAQSTNTTAANWFKSGLEEKEAPQKIAAYLKAIELDPLFVEAFYNLGLAYKQQGDDERAELFLRKAYAARPEKTKEEFKLQILFELAATYKRLGKLKYYEESLRRANNLTVDPALKVTGLLELGRLLYEQGHFEEAITELQEGQKLSPANQDHFKKIIQLAEGALELQKLYAAAAAATANGNLTEAKALFEQIMAKNPNDKNVEIKLAALDSLRQAAVKQDNLAAIYEQAQQHADAGNFEAAITNYTNLLQQNGNYKDAGVRLEAARQQLAQRQLKPNLENDYAASKARSLNPNYQEVTNRLAEVEKVLEQKNRLASTIAATSAVSMIIVSLDSLYQTALVAMVKEDWMQAALTLEKLQVLRPNFRDVPDLLARARVHLNMAAKTGAVPPTSQLATRTNLLYIGGGLMVLLILAAGIFSPTGRARIHLWRGNRAAAEAIYENILASHPQRVNLYPQLAELYLSEGRHDEFAMKIYKKTLQLSLPDRQRKALRQFMTQNYLEDGKQNGDAGAD